MANNFTIEDNPPIACTFTIYANDTPWGDITGNIEDQTDLINFLDSISGSLEDEISNLSQTVTENYSTLDDKIDTTKNDLNDTISAGYAVLDNEISELSSIVSSNYDTLDGKIDTHIADKTNPHEVTKAQVGLGNCDNTSDLNKPISTATQTALDGKVPTSRTINSKALTSDITLDYSDVGALSAETTINDLTDSEQQAALNSGATTTNIGQITTNANDISNIQDLIPNQASSSNQLADKQYVNNAVQTNSAHFRGNWSTWANVPTDVNDYPADDDGNKTPTTNDYMVVQNASDYTGETLTGAWQFTYTGLWSTNGKAGWQPRFQINESPLTPSQQAALDSGITSSLVSQIGTNQSNIQTINTTLSGYGDIVTHNVNEFATAGQGAKADTALQQGDNISLLNNNAGYITGIGSSDVITALGYTPYNSTNPNGYQANVIETIKVNDIALTPTLKAVNITVPTNNNQLTNGAGYITSSAIANMQTTTNLVTSVSSSSTDSQYPSAKLFYDTCGDIETLINAL